MLTARIYGPSKIAPARRDRCECLGIRRYVLVVIYEGISHDHAIIEVSIHNPTFLCMGDFF